MPRTATAGVTATRDAIGLAMPATGLPGRVTYEMVLPGMATTTGAVAVADYGLAVDEPPPASEVTDGAFPFELSLGSPAP